MLGRRRGGAGKWFIVVVNRLVFFETGMSGCAQIYAQPLVNVPRLVTCGEQEDGWMLGND